jgi:hypothetical protein
VWENSLSLERPLPESIVLHCSSKWTSQIYLPSVKQFRSTRESLHGAVVCNAVLGEYGIMLPVVHVILQLRILLRLHTRGSTYTGPSLINGRYRYPHRKHANKQLKASSVTQKKKNLVCLLTFYLTQALKGTSCPLSLQKEQDLEAN